MSDSIFVNRELSWLAFNERVLQEAADDTVPLIERIRFLGIFSNNRDEFFRVRVATVKRMIDLGKKAKAIFGSDPEAVMDQIQKTVLKQERQFNEVYQSIRTELGERGIYIINERQLSREQHSFVLDYFKNKVRPAMVPVMLDKTTSALSLKDKVIYLAIKLYKKDKPKKARYAYVEIPSQVLPRFLVLPEKAGKKYIILLDDIIRLGLADVFRIFRFDTIEAFTFKITRDAELDIDNDISAGWLEKMEQGLRNRKIGDPVRFVYDREMPKDMMDVLTMHLGLFEIENIIPAARYHNFKDFMDFPDIGASYLRNDALPPVKHKDLKDKISYIDVIAKKDLFLSYPYQTFNYIIDLLREAAIDPKVTSIQINLYRVAKNSKIINALINAAKNGKTVNVIVELQARFDEENNIKISNKLQDEGVNVIFGVPGLKVHSKLILITRKEGRKIRYYSHIGTGNFHEGTARIYGDHALLTANQEIGKEVAKVFEFFQKNYKRAIYRHLIVSPYNVRRKFVNFINREIRNAKNGKEAYIILKLNNLVDEQMIKKLYEASQAGVKIKMMVRGICSLIPGKKGLSENIECYSVVDRFLEHARVLVFCNNGDEEIFISSADWMTRNLDFRVEVTTPIYDPDIKKEIREILDIQFSDNVKCRIVDKNQKNRYRIPKEDETKVRSQLTLYNYFKNKVS